MKTTAWAINRGLGRACCFTNVRGRTRSHNIEYRRVTDRALVKLSTLNRKGKIALTF